MPRWPRTRRPARASRVQPEAGPGLRRCAVRVAPGRRARPRPASLRRPQAGRTTRGASGQAHLVAGSGLHPAAGRRRPRRRPSQRGQPGHASRAQQAAVQPLRLARQFGCHELAPPGARCGEARCASSIGHAAACVWRAQRGRGRRARALETRSMTRGVQGLQADALRSRCSVRGARPRATKPDASDAAAAAAQAGRRRHDEKHWSRTRDVVHTAAAVGARRPRTAHRRQARPGARRLRALRPRSLAPRRDGARRGALRVDACACAAREAASRQRARACCAWMSRARGGAVHRTARSGGVSASAAAPRQPATVPRQKPVSRAGGARPSTPPLLPVCERLLARASHGAARRRATGASPWRARAMALEREPHTARAPQAATPRPRASGVALAAAARLRAGAAASAARSSRSAPPALVVSASRVSDSLARAPLKTASTTSVGRRGRHGRDGHPGARHPGARAGPLACGRRRLSSSASRRRLPRAPRFSPLARAAGARKRHHTRLPRQQRPHRRTVRPAASA